ncbi:MAG: signal peptidase II [Deltaproteobacteria bacterium]|nr:signal peptidase II [Deltaproteobacteria bacterium]
MKSFFILALIAAAVIALDQFTKYLICANLGLYGRIEVLPGFLDIIHIRNSGVAFGFLKGFGTQYKTLSLIGVAAVAVFLLGFLISQLRRDQKLQAFSLALILGGAIGNIIDRFRLGEVVDFVDAHWQDMYHWPAFNVADMAISIGIVLLLADELLLRKKPALQKKADHKR